MFCKNTISEVLTTERKKTLNKHQQRKKEAIKSHQQIDTKNER